MGRSNRELEEALRRTVQAICRTGDLENLTVKRVRKATEEELKLPEEFFKHCSVWKDRSKRIIEEEAETQAEAVSGEDHIDAQAASSRGISIVSAKTSAPKSRNKRPPLAKDITTKRQKVDQDSKVNLSSSRRPGGSDVATNKDKSEKASKKGQKAATNDDPSQDDVAIAEGVQETPKTAQDEPLESDMSEVLDDEPQKKSKKRLFEGGTSKNQKVAKPKEKREKKAKDENLDPDAEEIKRLQGWLVKCGVRKMWYKELAPYEGQKAKIRHLKDLLVGIGMTGRYSVEKATQIREARELKSELEAVQEGAKQWGKEDSDVEGKARSRRKVARGLQNLDFLNDDDGAET